MTITQPTKSVLSRYTAGFISETNRDEYFQKLNIDRNITHFNS